MIDAVPWCAAQLIQQVSSGVDPGRIVTGVAGAASAALGALQFGLGAVMFAAIASAGAAFLLGR